MNNVRIAATCLMIAGAIPANAQMTSGQTPSGQPSTAESVPGGPKARQDGTATDPARLSETTIPRSGVIRPNPNTTQDDTVKPPNVDPGITIPPPGTPGSGVAVNPK